MVRGMSVEDIELAVVTGVDAYATRGSLGEKLASDDGMAAVEKTRRSTRRTPGSRACGGAAGRLLGPAAGLCLCSGSAAHPHLGFWPGVQRGTAVCPKRGAARRLLQPVSQQCAHVPGAGGFFQSAGRPGRAGCDAGGTGLQYAVRQWGAVAVIPGAAPAVWRQERAVWPGGGVFVPSVPVVRPHCVYRHSYIALSHRCAGAVAQCTGAARGRRADAALRGCGPFGGGGAPG